MNFHVSINPFQNMRVSRVGSNAVTFVKNIGIVGAFIGRIVLIRQNGFDVRSRNVAADDAT